MANASHTYDQIYLKVKNGFTGDSSIWDQTYEYIRLHPKDLFLISPHRIWSIGHQIIYHGNIQLFQRILTLYNEKENPIDIRSTTKDTTKPKTILDIANERKEYYKDQYGYIKRLFDQDKFIEACKKEDWSTIDAMLAQDPTLINEKPLYCSNYFIHHLIHYGDVRKFDEYNLQNNPFRLELQNADGKTALDLANEGKKKELIEELERLLQMHVREREPTMSSQLREDFRRDDTVDVPKEKNNQSTVPVPISLREPTTILVQPPPQPSPAPIAVSPQVLKNLTCKLTKKIFVDPVKASDGKTYERAAIKQYLLDNRFSPETGEQMNDEFIDDITTRDLISKFRQQKLLS
ncbi:unnamed protein product [Rotaria sp. Silwood2]|nr:unnamed protein product [Rotaria sp. Silwood2]